MRRILITKQAAAILAISSVVTPSFLVAKSATKLFSGTNSILAKMKKDLIREIERKREEIRKLAKKIEKEKEAELKKLDHELEQKISTMKKEEEAATKKLRADMKKLITQITKQQEEMRRKIAEERKKAIEELKKKFSLKKRSVIERYEQAMMDAVRKIESEVLGQTAPGIATQPQLQLARQAATPTPEVQMKQREPRTYEIDLTPYKTFGPGRDWKQQLRTELSAAIDLLEDAFEADAELLSVLKKKSVRLKNLISMANNDNRVMIDNIKKEVRKVYILATAYLGAREIAATIIEEKKLPTLSGKTKLEIVKKLIPYVNKLISSGGKSIDRDVLEFVAKEALSIFPLVSATHLVETANRKSLSTEVQSEQVLSSTLIPHSRGSIEETAGILGAIEEILKKQNEALVAKEIGLKKVSNELGGISAKLSQSEKKIKELEDELAKTRKELVENRVEIEKVRKIKEELKKIATETGVSLENSAVIYEHAGMPELSIIAHRIAELKAAINAKKEEIEKIKNEYEKRLAEATAEKKEALQAVSKVAELRAEIAALKNGLIDRASFNERISELKSMLAKQSTYSELHRRALERIEQIVNEHMSGIRALRHDIGGLVDELRTVKNELSRRIDERLVSGANDNATANQILDIVRRVDGTVTEILRRHSISQRTPQPILQPVSVPAVTQPPIPPVQAPQTLPAVSQPIPTTPPRHPTATTTAQEANPPEAKEHLAPETRITTPGRGEDFTSTPEVKIATEVASGKNESGRASEGIKQEGTQTSQTPQQLPKRELDLSAFTEIDTTPGVQPEEGVAETAEKGAEASNENEADGESATSTRSGESAEDTEDDVIASLFTS